MLPQVSACGMASATTMLLALVPAGGHIVTTTDCYRRTRQVGAASDQQGVPMWARAVDATGYAAAHRLPSR